MESIHGLLPVTNTRLQNWQNLPQHSPYPLRTGSAYRIQLQGQPMSTMNISLPDTLKDFVDEQVSVRGYGTSSEYVRELIRHDQDRQQLRSLLLAGAATPPAKPADQTYFDGLRARVNKSGRAKKR